MAKIWLPKNLRKALKEKAKKPKKALKPKKKKKKSNLDKFSYENMLSEELLLLCLRFKRCIGCRRVLPRGIKFGFSYCPECQSLTIKKRLEFLRWHEKIGKPLENVLPKPMPKKGEIQKMLMKIRRQKTCLKK